MSSKSGYEMIEIPQALQIVLNECSELDEEMVPNGASALGRCVARDVIAAEPVPPFRASMIDGYAMVSSDGEGEFPVVGFARAGTSYEDSLKSGQVMYITTGAPLPEGADGIAWVEDSEKCEDPGKIKILKGAIKGKPIREIGSDIARGECVLPKGCQIGVAETGLLATVGLSEIPVTRAPRVGVLSTGNEIANVGEELKFGQVRDSNRPMLLSALTKVVPQNCIRDLGIVRDDIDAVRNALSSVMDLDVLITSGGVSMGDKDLVKPVLEELGTIHFGRVLMKPGKPLTFATIDDPQTQKRRLVFGLPGNPVSSLVTFHLIVLPCLRKMLGFPNPNLTRVKVRVTQELKLDAVRPEYHRATIYWTENGKFEQWPDFGCEGIKVQRAHQPTSQCQGKKKEREGPPPNSRPLTRTPKPASS
eukprot:TRINITY_DN35857_c0_g1_i2.p1 TRINITY_DN35857_c0_g1~~TRINITY_DN35857_c0_g1_i2.p1  ORF type:complete len:419 (+),score=103.04 TRINITY_DN35857_c0_g1_i2:127-1383(+)